MAASNAIITLVASEDFIIGAQVMVHSLLETNSTHGFTIAVMVTNNISNDNKQLLLSSGFDQVIEIDEIPNPNSPSSVHVQNWIDVGFTKLRIWSLVQFDTALYIDADCVIVSDITHLFTDNPYKDVTFAAAPDVFPPDHFNAGVLLIKPNINTFNTLLREMPYIESYDGGDTGFLNRCSLFREWYSSNNQRLHFGYNAQRIMHWFTKQKPSYWTQIEHKLKIIHYSSSPKPWNIKPSKRLVDRVEIIWHKHLIALNQEMNANGNRKITLNAQNHIIYKTKATHAQPRYVFNKIKALKMSKGNIEFGRIYDGDCKDNAVEFEQRFVVDCTERLNAFLQNRSGSESNEQSSCILNGIPKIIHQIWLGPRAVPRQYKIWSASWRTLNPKWKHMLWTDESLNSFKWKSAVNKSLFEMAQNYGEKSDILRLEILYECGGVYVDYDFECIQTLDVIDGNSNISCFFGLSNTGLMEINNAIIGCKPQHEILRDIWKSIQVICSDDDETQTIVKTGPIQVTRCVMNHYSKYDDLLILPTQCFYPLPNNMRYLPIVDRFRYYDDATVGVHHWGVSWNHKHANHVTMNENKNRKQKEREKSKKCQMKTDENVNIIDSIMNTSDNIALQSKIMSFLQ
eukprot:709667_1